MAIKRARPSGSGLAPPSLVGPRPPVTARASGEPARARRRDRGDDHPKRRDARGRGNGGPGRRATASLRFRAADPANRALAQRPLGQRPRQRGHPLPPWARTCPARRGGGWELRVVFSALRPTSCGADGPGGSAREPPDTDRRPPVRTVRFHNIPPNAWRLGLQPTSVEQERWPGSGPPHS